MRAVVQRVSRAEVRVQSKAVGSIEHGLCVLLCAMQGDNESDARFIARKVPSLRIFTDNAGKMNRSLIEVAGSILAVSQFTLSADTTSGTRPSFSSAMEPVAGRQLFDCTIQLWHDLGITVATGEFGAHMEVELVNDGPVTIMLDSRCKR
jgi:D-tyrosyl-tRNA(Tyr) deacylase